MASGGAPCPGMSTGQSAKLQIKAKKGPLTISAPAGFEPALTAPEGDATYSADLH